MKTVATSVKKFLRPNSRCPQAIQWLAVLMQLWGACIFLYTFSSGMFLTRLMFTNRLDQANSYAKYPQFWYVLLGCTVLPFAASRLKRGNRAGWTVTMCLMATMTTASMAILVADTDQVFNLGRMIPIAHAITGIVGTAVLFTRRQHFFRMWEPDPPWVHRPRLTWRDVLNSLVMNAKLLMGAPWKRIVLKMFSFLVCTAVLVTVVIGCFELCEDELETTAKVIDKKLDRLFSPSWDRRWRLHWFPITCYEQLYVTMEAHEKEVCVEIDNVAQELCALGAEQHLLEIRRHGLAFALYCNRRQMVEYYLARPRREDPTSAYEYMSSAIKSGNVMLVKRLLKEGYSLDVKHPRNLQTILTASVYGNQLTMAEWLIENGVDPCAKTTSNQTVLFTAAQYSQVEMADLFVKHGCDHLAKDVDGKTLFHHLASGYYARSEQKYAMIKWLADHGVNPHIKDNNGKAPVDYLYGDQVDEWNEMLAQVMGQESQKDTPEDWFESLNHEETAKTD